MRRSSPQGCRGLELPGHSVWRWRSEIPVFDLGDFRSSSGEAEQAWVWCLPWAIFLLWQKSSSTSHSAILGAFGRNRVTSRRLPALRIWAGDPNRSSRVGTAG